VTSLSIVTALLIIYGAISRRGYGAALALGGATAAGAAVVVGATAVPTFYAISLGAVVALVLSMVGSPFRSSTPAGGSPGVGLLIAFLVWSTLVTLVAPVIFQGTTVLAPGTGRRALAGGFFTSSNIAQVLYLILGVGVVAFLSRSSKAGPGLIGLAAGTTTLLSFWRYLHQYAGLPFPENFFDNSPSFAYIETAPQGVQRFRGILSEPAGLAVSCLVTIAYMLPRSTRLTGWRRSGALLVAAIAIFLGSVSTSATFVVAGGIVSFLALATFGLGFLSRRLRLSGLVTVVACGVVIGLVWVLPIIASFVEKTINQKVSSSSYNDRSFSDSTSYDLLLSTFGFGVGLGANRASSFLPGLLSTTGIVGTLLFTAAVVTLVSRGSRVSAYRPVVWALVTLLVVKLVSGPDLSDSSGILWISLGLLSRASRQSTNSAMLDSSSVTEPSRRELRRSRRQLIIGGTGHDEPL
jgi:hypothetical protein